MRVANKQEEYFPKPFSFSVDRSKPSVPNGDLKRIQNRIMEEKWDIHRKIKESLNMLNQPQA